MRNKGIVEGNVKLSGLRRLELTTGHLERTDC